jgi:hypothetical protein
MLMDQVHNELLPQWVQDLTAIADAGQQAFTTVAQSGQTEGAALVSASTDSLGNVTRIYTENGVAIGATITDAAGVVVNSFGSMGTGAVAAAGAMATGVTGQAAVMATGVTEQANLMTSGALTSVTNLGTGILTTVQATSGTTIATVTDMQGQVTSQYATLANGAQLSMDGLSAGVMTSTTDLGTGVLTIMQDTSGNYIATVTDMAGNVVSQYTQLGTDVVAAATEQTAGVTEQAQTMADTVLTSVTDLGDGTLTIVRDTSGEMVATITDMSGQVVETYSSMGSDVQGTMEEFASTTAEQFHSVEGPAGDAVSAMEEVGQVQIDAPDVSDIIGAMKDIQKAADRARSAVDTVDGKGGKQGGSGKKDPDFGKAVGGPVNMGQTYLVGEEGPELFTPGSSGTIIPNDRLAFGGGGDTIVVNVHVNGSLLANRRDIEEAVVVGLESAKRGPLMTSPRTIETEVFVDWNNDGTFTGAYDDVSADVLADPGVTVQYGRDQARSLSPPMIPSCDFTLDNESRRYSPENAGSPLYQLIQPGRPVKVQARHGDRRTYSSHISYNSHLPYNGKGTWPLFRGNIDTMQTSVAWGRRVTAFSALGMTAQLKRKTVSVALQTDIHTNDAVNLVLNAAGWTASRVLAIGDTVLDTWWVDERPAWDVILELIGSEGAGAMVFEKPDGEFLSTAGRRASSSPAPRRSGDVLRIIRGRVTALHQAHDVQPPVPYRSGGGLTYVDLSYDPRWEDVSTARRSTPSSGRCPASDRRLEARSAARALGWRGPHHLGTATDPIPERDLAGPDDRLHRDRRDHGRHGVDGPTAPSRS